MIADYRYNAFTSTFSPFAIGYGGDPEVQTIPSTSPFEITLRELPLQEVPSSVIITEQGVPANVFTEVSGTPSVGQFNIVYGGDGISVEGAVGQGSLRFNSADAGTILEIQYYGLGTVLSKRFFDKEIAPIGEIKAVHPNVKTAYLPNTDVWVPCDTAHAKGGVSETALSVTYFNLNGSDVDENYVPDLSDDRFLMGGAAYGVGGNASNQVTLTTAELPAHAHTASSGTQSANHVHEMTAVSGVGGSNGFVYDDTGSGAVKSPKPTTLNNFSDHSHTITVNSTGSGAAFSILPLYFKAKYYMKVA